MTGRTPGQTRTAYRKAAVRAAYAAKAPGGEGLMAASLLTAKDRRGHPPRAQIAKLARIARRAQCRADWLTTMLGEPGGDRKDPAYGYYTRMAATAGEANRLDWERDRRQARTDRDVARVKASRACAEVAAIAAEHDIQP